MNSLFVPLIVLQFSIFINSSETIIYLNGEYSESILISKGCDVYGRIRLVNSGEDFRVRIVDSGEDVRVRYVNSGANSKGRWRIVSSGEDFRIRIVNSGEDFRIRKVNSGEGGKK